MFELWARKRPVNGKGFQYEHITNFDNIDQRFYMTDQLDRNVYAECMVVYKDRCLMYVEFEQENVKRRIK